MFLINFGSHHHLKIATYSVHSFVFCCFFQISSKLNLFSCRDCVYSLSMILSVCFNAKKPIGINAFIDLIRLHLFFSQYAKARFPLGDKWQYLTISSGRYHPVRRGVFRTLLNMYDEAFNRVLFRRSFARDFWEGPECATDISQCLLPLCLCIDWIILFTSVS